MPEQRDLDKINEMIRNIGIAMLTTDHPDGFLRSRPMVSQQTPFDGSLWFFVRLSGETADEVKNNPRVNATYSDHDNHIYVSLSGDAELLQDVQKARSLWNPLVQAWFPDGPEDPDLSLLRVTILQGEYWDSSSSKMVGLFGKLKAAITGEPRDKEETKKLQFK